jgi:hypothetical protein
MVARDAQPIRDVKVRDSAGLRYTLRVSDPPILLGTSSFTDSGWNGSFYPRGMKPSDYFAFYAERFHTVEVDSTFYACPTARTLENWDARTRSEKQPNHRRRVTSYL